MGIYRLPLARRSPLFVLLRIVAVQANGRMKRAELTFTGELGSRTVYVFRDTCVLRVSLGTALESQVCWQTGNGELVILFWLY